MATEPEQQEQAGPSKRQQKTERLKPAIDLGYGKVYLK